MQYQISDFQKPGQRYILSFAWQGVAFPTVDLQNSLIVFQAIMQNPVVTHDGSFSGNMDIEYTAPSGSSLQFSVIVSGIMQVWSELGSFSITFIKVVDVGDGGSVKLDTCGVSNPTACFQDTKTLAYLAITILVLIVVVKVT